MPEYDVVIDSGRVLDPQTGFDDVRNVGIVGDTIARITSDPLEGTRRIDARGLVVAPGFIELFQHAHDPESYQLNALDGVTASLDLEVLNGGTLDLKPYEGHSLLHYATSASHAAARLAVSAPPSMGLDDRPCGVEEAGPELIARVKDALEVAVSDGDLGIQVVAWPGVSRYEVIEMFRFAAERGQPVFVRPRSRGKVEPGSGIEAIEEVIGAAAISGAVTHIVHVHMFALSQTAEVLSMLEGARAHGIKITADARPYADYSSNVLAEVFNPGWQERTGMTYEDLRLVTGERLTQERFDALRASRQSTRVVAPWLSQEMVDAAILSPFVMISGHAAKDGPYTAGTFARVIAQYVRAERRLSLMDAVRKMSLMPAQLLERVTPVGARKGRLQVGADADVVIFDPLTISDQATEESATSPSVGVQYLLVAGQLVVAEGKIVPNVAPGRRLVALERSVSHADGQSTTNNEWE